MRVHIMGLPECDTA